MSRIDWFPDLSERSHDLELMDDPDCDKVQLINTVKQFRILNFLFSRSRYIIKKHMIKKIMKPENKQYTFLDLGAGGCDLPIWLIRYCHKHQINIQVTCLDNDKTIIDYAQKRCQNFTNIHILEYSAFDLEQLDDYDFIFANHFLHHLSDESILELIMKILKKARLGFVINDIHRTNFAYFFYSLFTGLFMHQSFAFYDGRLSIKRGFKLKELQALLKKADLSEEVRVKKVFPSRIIVYGK